MGIRFFFVFIMIAVCWTVPAHPEISPGTAVNFRLHDAEGRSHELYRYGVDAKAIVLIPTATGCPIAQKSIPTLKELRDGFKPQGIEFLMINSNPYDDAESIAKEAKEFENDIPILIDKSQLVARAYELERTCEALLIQPKTWNVLYRGAVDDRLDYIAAKPEAHHKWLEDALNAFLAGQDVSVKTSEVKGCLINYEDEPQNISYSKDVAPILIEHCAECHSPDNIAPFAFTSHKQVAGRAKMIKEVILTQRMPPWHADPHYGQFTNDRSLSVKEHMKLAAWIDAGAPKDGETDPLEAVENMAPKEWPLGEPDLILQLPNPQEIPATGVVPYIGVRLDTGLTEDKWVRAAEIQPTNRRVTHHVLAFVKYPAELKDQEPDDDGGVAGYFAGYVPGMAPTEYPEGTGKWLPAGSSFRFQLHYTTTGKPETDQTRLGLYFCDEKPAQVFETNAASNPAFEIPPGAYDFEASANHYISRDSLLWSMSPHMHYRGSRMKYVAQYPDGTEEVLLSVPNYRFDWQTLYTFDEPKKLPGGTVIRAVGAWDNSVRNEYNPDPAATVHFGEQTFEEMFIAYMNYSYDPDAPVVRRQRSRGDDGRDRDEGIRTGVALTPENIVGTVWDADKYTFEWQADGKVLVNGAIQGTYTIEGNVLNFHVAGTDHTFYIHGDILTNSPEPTRWHLRRVK